MLNNKIAARTALIIGIPASEALLLRAAGRGVSIVLVLVMTAWILAPYGGLALARWLAGKRVDLLTLTVALGSLAVYAADAVKPFSSKAAFVYVVTPLAAWAIILITTLVMRAASRQRRT